MEKMEQSKPLTLHEYHIQIDYQKYNSSCISNGNMIWFIIDLCDFINIKELINDQSVMCGFLDSKAVGSVLLASAALKPIG